MFFDVDHGPRTGFRLDSGLKPGYYFEGEGGSTFKGKTSTQINPWRVLAITVKFDTS